MNDNLPSTQAAGAIVDSHLSQAWADALAEIAAIDGLSEADREHLRDKAKAFLLEERETRRQALIDDLLSRGIKVPAHFAEADPAAIFSPRQ